MPMDDGGPTPVRRLARHTTLHRIGARLYAPAGAAAFVASLGYFAYAYGVRFGATSQPSTAVGIAGGLAVNTGLFTVFALHHSLLARSGGKRLAARHLPDGLERATYVWGRQHPVRSDLRLVAAAPPALSTGRTAWRAPWASPCRRRAAC